MYSDLFANNEVTVQSTVENIDALQLENKKLNERVIELEKQYMSSRDEIEKLKEQQERDMSDEAEVQQRHSDEVTTEVMDEVHPPKEVQQGYSDEVTTEVANEVQQNKDEEKDVEGAKKPCSLVKRVKENKERKSKVIGEDFTGDGRKKKKGDIGKQTLVDESIALALLADSRRVNTMWVWKKPIEKSLTRSLKLWTLDFLKLNYANAMSSICEMSERQVALYNQNLVELFLKNARKMIKEDGEIHVHVTHKSNGFFLEWKLAKLAWNNGLQLLDDVQFKLSDYPGYNTKYGFGGDHNFDCNPSKTYKFVL
ncbi:hypothetical protein IFM89_027011 [Coptis chinensis]|uniref:25S rRNA (uridine-N(3))-methyltransferase BMT5-like domain-containing protein n=1 Tax=Coptis chinensis TaxID=261450 RepID=A0A835GY99_9MAGN|nr:hypothetical protein IFM89_027011 [Coptis chinensis]